MIVRCLALEIIGILRFPKQKKFSRVDDLEKVIMTCSKKKKDCRFIKNRSWFHRKKNCRMTPANSFYVKYLGFISQIFDYKRNYDYIQCRNALSCVENFVYLL